jgi:tetratricopeptide (TPR) repeat protein
MYGYRSPPLPWLALIVCIASVCSGGAVHGQTVTTSSSREAPALPKADDAPSKAPWFTDTSAATFKKALALMDAGKWEEAATLLQALTAERPDLAPPWNNLGVIRARQGRKEEALDMFNIAVRINPNYATAQENLGDLHADMARRAYDRALPPSSEKSSASRNLRTKRDALSSLFSNALLHTPSPDSQKPDEAGVRSALMQWAAHWSNREVDAYLSAYADDFATPGGMARPAWEKSRRKRIAAVSGYLDITLDAFKITLDGENAQARFRQTYTTTQSKAISKKQLSLAYRSGRWLITREQSSR